MNVASSAAHARASSDTVHAAIATAGSVDVELRDGLIVVSVDGTAYTLASPGAGPTAAGESLGFYASSSIVLDEVSVE